MHQLITNQFPITLLFSVNQFLFSIFGTQGSGLSSAAPGTERLFSPLEGILLQLHNKEILHTLMFSDYKFVQNFVFFSLAHILLLWY